MRVPPACRLRGGTRAVGGFTRACRVLTSSRFRRLRDDGAGREDAKPRGETLRELLELPVWILGRPRSPGSSVRCETVPLLLPKKKKKENIAF